MASPPAAAPLRATPKAVISRLERLLPQAARHARPGPVHRLRTHIRRVEALLAVQRPEQADSKLCKQLHKLRRRAGRVRDLDVHMALLRSLEVEGDNGRKRALLEAMEQRRESEAARLRDKLDAAARRELARRLRRAGKATEQAAQPATDMRRRLGREAGELDRRFATLDAGNLHEFRIGCKRLRYLAESGGREFGSLATQLKRTQDAIGVWHDWLELLRRAERACSKDPHNSLLAALRNVTAAQYAEALRAAVATRSAWPFAPIPRRQVGRTGGNWVRTAYA